MKKNIRTLLVVMAIAIFFLWYQTNIGRDARQVEDGGGITGNLVNDELVANDEADSNRIAADVVEDVLDQFEVDHEEISIAYVNLQSGDSYYLNEEVIMNAASTTKVAIAALFVDLIQAGELQWETELPYWDVHYEEGKGDITNFDKRAVYPVEELISEMLIHSDNTATNILVDYYIDAYGGTFFGYREAIVELSEIENLSPKIYEENVATAKMLAQTLIHIASDERYAPLTDMMMEAQSGVRLSKYISEGMATKSGDFEEWQHDVGAYYEGDTPLYVLVVMTEGVSRADEFMAVMNLRLNSELGSAS